MLLFLRRLEDIAGPGGDPVLPVDQDLDLGEVLDPGAALSCRRQHQPPTAVLHLLKGVRVPKHRKMKLWEYMKMENYPPRTLPRANKISPSNVGRKMTKYAIKTEKKLKRGRKRNKDGKKRTSWAASIYCRYLFQALKSPVR